MSYSDIVNGKCTWPKVIKLLWLILTCSAPKCYSCQINKGMGVSRKNVNTVESWCLWLFGTSNTLASWEWGVHFECKTCVSIMNILGSIQCAEGGSDDLKHKSKEPRLWRELDWAESGVCQEKSGGNYRNSHLVSPNSSALQKAYKMAQIHTK